MDKPFKRCTCCDYRWENEMDLIRDRNLFVNGYQASFENSLEGLFFFTHDVEGCGTTIAIRAGDFYQLYDGPEHIVNMAHTGRCFGYCLSGDDQGECPNPCEMCWARDILKILRNHGSDEHCERRAAEHV